MILSWWTPRNNELQFFLWSWEQINHVTGDLVNASHVAKTPNMTYTGYMQDRSCCYHFHSANYNSHNLWQFHCCQASTFKRRQCSYHLIL